MKTKILEGLRGKFEGLQDSVLNRIAEKLAKTVTTDEQVATAIEGVTFQQVVDSYTDSRVTEASQTAVANYEKKHNIKDGKVVEVDPAKKKEPNPNPNEEPEPAWAKQFMTEMQELKSKLQSFEGEKVATTRTKKLDQLLTEIKTPEQLKNSYKKAFLKMDFTDDDDFNNYLQEVKTELEPFVTELEQKGVIINTPPAGKGATQKEPSEDVKQRIEERKTEVQHQPSVIKGLPNQ